MRLLIDECVDERLRLLFPGHECQTARFANLAGLKNGRLLEAAEAVGFDILISATRVCGKVPARCHQPDRRRLLVLTTSEWERAGWQKKHSLDTAIGETTSVRSGCRPLSVS